MSAHRPIATALWLALTGCPTPQGQACGEGNACPLNDYCLLDHCLAPSFISENLSVVVTPSDPTLAPQQFLPSQLQTIDGETIVLMDAPQVLNVPVPLPANCADAGYPIHFEFTGASLIPSIGNDFAFDSNDRGELFGTLPIGTFQARISTAVACAAPILTAYVVSQSGPFNPLDLSLSFPAPPAPGQLSDAGEGDVLEVSGQVIVSQPDAGLPIGATVRILGDLAAGAPTGAALSGDQMLLLSDGGALVFGSSYVPGGPACLPVWAGGVPQSTCGQVTCRDFILEIGPSKVLPYLTTLDQSIQGSELAPLGDAGPGSVQIVTRLPLNPMATFPLSVLALDPRGGVVDTAAVSVVSIDGGIAGCTAPNTSCRFSSSQTTDPSKGTVTFPVLPGTYLVTLDPPLPLGPSTVVVEVLAGGQLEGTTVGHGQVQIVAAPPIHVSGLVREPAGEGHSNGPPVSAGEAEILTLPDLAPMALQALAAGAFDLEVPPGRYALVIQPDSSTRFPVYTTTLQVGQTAPAPLNINLLEPGQLAGVLRLRQDTGQIQGQPDEPAGDGGGLPQIIPGALLEFYFVTSDSEGDGGAIAFPVASAVTDSQGRWFAAGPPEQ
jgi:hypothetical protein